MTTANFPDVMLPAYGMSPAYTIFFLLYMILGLYFLFNLVLAVVYTNYTWRVEQQMEDFETKRNNFLKSFFPDKESINYDECRKLLTELISITETNIQARI